MQEKVQDDFKKSFDAAVPKILAICSDYDRMGTMARLRDAPTGVLTWMVRGRSRWGLDACIERGDVVLMNGRYFLTPQGHTEFARLDGTIGEFSRNMEGHDGIHPIQLSDFGFLDGVRVLTIMVILFMPMVDHGVIAGIFLLHFGLVCNSLMALKTHPPRHVRLDCLRMLIGIVAIGITWIRTSGTLVF